MAVSAEIRIQGLQALQEKLRQRKEVLEKALDLRLMQLAEDAVTHAKQNKGYKDRTKNLYNSISFALYKNGTLVKLNAGNIPDPKQAPKNHKGVEEKIQQYASQPGVVASKGYSLIVVAGMEYGAHVEHKGYNVLYLTKHFLHKEMKQILEEVIQVNQ